MITKLQRESVRENLPHATVEPSSLADIVKNDLAVLCTALELIQDRVDLPPELRAIVDSARVRSYDIADRIREFQRVGAIPDSSTTRGVRIPAPLRRRRAAQLVE